MKQKYTLIVANSQMNIVTEMPKDEIDAIVGIVDRRIREIHLHSKSCSRADAAVLLCLDYCAEKIELQKTLKSVNAQMDKLTLSNEAANKHIASLEREINTLRASLNLSSTKTVLVKKQPTDQLAIDQFNGIEDINTEKPQIEENNFEEIKEESTIEKAKPISNAVEEILSAHAEEVTSETLTPPTDSEKPHAKARKKKVRAMFDMISFDDI